MRRWQKRCLRGACIIFMAVGLVPFIGAGKSLAAESSCVTCHTDEDMLEETVTIVKAKKSAMQSGAG